MTHSSSDDYQKYYSSNLMNFSHQITTLPFKLHKLNPVAKGIIERKSFSAGYLNFFLYFNIIARQKKPKK